MARVLQIQTAKLQRDLKEHGFEIKEGKIVKKDDSEEKSYLN